MSIAIDGKVLRGSCDHVQGKAGIDMVSAWATANHWVQGKVKVDDKMNLTCSKCYLTWAYRLRLSSCRDERDSQEVDRHQAICYIAPANTRRACRNSCSSSSKLALGCASCQVSIQSYSALAACSKDALHWLRDFVGAMLPLSCFRIAA